jgi:hypothetical protein
VIKVYSVTFSLIYEHEKEQRLSSVTYSSCINEHEKEQRLSSVTYSHVFTSMRKNKD